MKDRDFKKQIQEEVLQKIYKTKQNEVEQNLLILLSMITSKSLKKRHEDEYVYTNMDEKILKMYNDILQEMFYVKESCSLKFKKIVLKRNLIKKILNTILVLEIFDIVPFVQGIILNDFKISDLEKEYKVSFKYTTKIFEEILEKEELESFKKHEIFKKLEQEYSFNKINANNSVYTCVLNSGEKIYTLFGNLGLTKTLLQFEEIRITKEINMDINRSVNFEVANLAKKMKTSTYQLKVIKYIEENNLTSRLTEKQKEYMNARKNNVESSIKDIADILKISKTSANSRFKAIEEIYNEERKEK